MIKKWTVEKQKNLLKVKTHLEDFKLPCEIAFLAGLSIYQVYQYIEAIEFEKVWLSPEERKLIADYRKRSAISVVSGVLVKENRSF